jgi:hypothetical protein
MKKINTALFISSLITASPSLNAMTAFPCPKSILDYEAIQKATETATLITCYTHKPDNVSQTAWCKTFASLRHTDSEVLVINDEKLTKEALQNIITALPSFILEKIRILDIIHNQVIALPIAILKITHLQDICMDKSVLISTKLQRAFSTSLAKAPTIYRA